MKFSVLLPTRNGGCFLANCIRSILEQPYYDMELVVSDNANTDQTQEVLALFAHEERLKVVRLDTPVSVTENWNQAFKASLGDYILMMGDDDCLLPGYFEKLEKIIDKYGNPDCITYNAYGYIAHDSIGGNMQSYYKETFFKFGPEFKVEGLLSSKMRYEIVRDMFRFRNRIPLNMQTTLISRKATKMIVGDVFQPPFPDHYALNSLLLLAKSWVYLPEKPLVVGVSPKSFGHFVYSGKQEEGNNYLGIASEFKNRLPGSELNNCMHMWLCLLKTNYKKRLENVHISRADYVRRQVYSWYIQYKLRSISVKEICSRFCKLSLGDWILLCSSVFDKASWQRLGLTVFTLKNNKVKRFWHQAHQLDNISNIKEFADWISR